MNYAGMPWGMWALYRTSFCDCLVSELGFCADEAKCITTAAKLKYREIIAGMPEFEKGDRFKMNIVSCEFVRSHTLALGGPYCDCGYKKTNRSGAR